MSSAADKPSGTEAPARLGGIDWLRIAAMFMVVLFHLLIWTEEGGRPVPGDWYRAAARYLRAECACAVDLFVLASGFLLVGRRPRPMRLVRLALQVYLTSAAVRLVAGAVSREPVGWRGFFSDYWFWNAYLVVALLSPILDAGLLAVRRAWPTSRVRALLAALAVFLAVVPLPGGLGFAERGFTPLWLAVPYLVGAEIALERREDGLVLARPWKLETLAWLLPLAGWIGSSILRRFPAFAHLSLNGSYASPVVFAMSVCHLLFFANLRTGRLPRPAHLAAATSFGVYLIHAHPLVQPFLRGLLDAFAIRSSAPVLLASVLIAAISVHAACSLLDLPRHLLFARISQANDPSPRKRKPLRTAPFFC